MLFAQLFSRWINLLTQKRMIFIPLRSSFAHYSFLRSGLALRPWLALVQLCVAGFLLGFCTFCPQSYNFVLQSKGRSIVIVGNFSGDGQSPPVGTDQAGHRVQAHLQGNHRGENSTAGQVHTLFLCKIEPVYGQKSLVHTVERQTDRMQTQMSLSKKIDFAAGVLSV